MVRDSKNIHSVHNNRKEDFWVIFLYTYITSKYITESSSKVAVQPCTNISIKLCIFNKEKCKRMITAERIGAKAKVIILLLSFLVYFSLFYPFTYIIVALFWHQLLCLVGSYSLNVYHLNKGIS